MSNALAVYSIKMATRKYLFRKIRELEKKPLEEIEGIIEDHKSKSFWYKLLLPVTNPWELHDYEAAKAVRCIKILGLKEFPGTKNSMQIKSNYRGFYEMLYDLEDQVKQKKKKDSLENKLQGEKIKWRIWRIK